MQPAEAPAILAAYFDAAGMSGIDAHAVHIAVLAWQLACGYASILQQPERAAEADVWRRRLGEAVGAMG